MLHKPFIRRLQFYLGTRSQLNLVKLLENPSWINIRRLLLDEKKISTGCCCWLAFEQTETEKSESQMPTKGSKCTQRTLQNPVNWTFLFCWVIEKLHSGQMHDACAVPAIILQRKIPTNVKRFTLTAKLNAFFENVSFLSRVCVENEVTDIHKFYRREIWFIRNFPHRFHTNFTLVKIWTDSNLKALEERKWLNFLRLTAVNWKASCVWPLWTLRMLLMHFTWCVSYSSYGWWNTVGCPGLHVSLGQHDREIPGTASEISREPSRLQIHRPGFYHWKGFREGQKVSAK